MKKKFFAAVLLAVTLVTGALPATAFAASMVDEVAITVTAPTVGANPNYTATVAATPNGSAYFYEMYWGAVDKDSYTGEVTSTEWEDLSNSSVFETGKYYVCAVTLKANDGYGFGYEDTVATINNEWLTDAIINRDADGMMAYYVFDLTDGGGSSTHTHTYDDTWTSDVDYHWHWCTDENCPDKTGSIIDKAEHTFEWVVTSEPTTTEGGLQSEVCTVCGFTRNAGTFIPKLTSTTDSTSSDSSSTTSDSSSDSASSGTLAKTGDTMNCEILMFATFASAAVLGVAIYRRKKQESK